MVDDVADDHMGLERDRRWKVAGWRCAAALSLPVVLALLSCGSARDAGADRGHAEPPITADIIQLRRDQVLQRVEVAVRNAGTEDIVVQRLQLEVEGFDIPGPISKDSPIPAGQVVNLPVPYDDVDCPANDAAEVGKPRVTLLVRSGGATRRVRLTARDDGLLGRIATRACDVERAGRDVKVRFSDRWRVEARLLGDEPRTITDVAGAILYGLRPAETASAVWIGTPGTEDIAITPSVGDATKRALRQVCTF